MAQKVERVVLDEPHPWYLLVSIFAGLLSRFGYFLLTQTASEWRKKRDQEARPARIAGLFEYLRDNKEGRYATDASSLEYAAFFDACADVIVPQVGKIERIIDFGSGTLAFYTWLTRHGLKAKKYLGVDLTQSGVQKYATKHPEISLIEADIESLTLPKGETFDFAVAINTLLYIEDINAFLEVVKESGARRLMIVEPIPSLHWLTYYSGIRVQLRNGKTLEKAAHRHGWIKKIHRYLYFRSRIGSFAWPISQLMIFEK